MSVKNSATKGFVITWILLLCLGFSTQASTPPGVVPVSVRERLDEIRELRVDFKRARDDRSFRGFQNREKLSNGIRDRASALLALGPEATEEEFPALKEELISAGILEKEKWKTLWSPEPQSRTQKALLFVPRLLEKSVETLFESKLIKRAANTVRIPITFATRGLQAGLHVIPESPLNALATVNEALDDVGSISKIPHSAGGFTTNRVQVCTVTLGVGKYDDFRPRTLISPAEHVGTLVDMGYDLADPRGEGILLHAMRVGSGIRCKSPSVLRDSSESVAIERLSCIARQYVAKTGYQFLTYNCGGFQKDTLTWAGMTYPTFPDAGIGNTTLFFPPKERDEWGPKFTRECDEHIQRITAMIAAAENGKTWTEADVDHIFESRSYRSDDLRLQLWVTAARGGNTANRENLVRADRVKSDLPESHFEAYFDERGRIKPSLKAHLTQLIGVLSREQLEWLEKYLSPAASVYRTLARRD